MVEGCARAILSMVEIVLGSFDGSVKGLFADEAADHVWFAHKSTSSSSPMRTMTGMSAIVAVVCFDVAFALRI